MLSEAVKGDLRSALEALRDSLASEIEDGSRCVKCGGGLSSPTPALAKQLRDVLNQLASMPGEKRSVTDDLKAKRARRQAGVAKRASGSVDKRAGGGRTRG